MLRAGEEDGAGLRHRLNWSYRVLPRAARKEGTLLAIVKSHAPIRAIFNLPEVERVFLLARTEQPAPKCRSVSPDGVVIHRHLKY